MAVEYEAPVPASAPHIELRDITKIHYSAGGEVRALDDVNIKIAPGQFLTLLGPSGCGKSTLLNLIAALDRPSTGSVIFGGAERISPDRNVAFNFQEPAVFPWRDVLGNVTIALEHCGLPRSEVDQFSEDALEAVGLTQFKRSYGAQLSGGMKQRLMLARSLAMNAPVMLMDEPFAALDAITRESMQDLLTTLYMNRGFSIVFVTHSIEEALFMSQRVLVMSARPGRVVHEVILEEPYPRTYEWRLSSKVANLRRELHELLASESCSESPHGTTGEQDGE